jgi:dihydroorotate dehydrogenase electron transfer subunit
MAQQRLITIADQRAATPRLRWLTLDAPEIARSARAGQYLLVRCAEVGSYDPLLRRPLFIAATAPELGQVGLLFEPAERGLVWLARGRAGDTLDILGPLGRPFALAGRTRNLLLIGAGAGLGALLLLAREAAARGCAVTLLAGAAHDETLPPPFLLPGEVEYQSIVGPAIDLLDDPRETRETSQRQGDTATKRHRERQGSPPHPLTLSPLHPIAWADQVCAALPDQQLRLLRDAIRSVKYRWERGFASALLEGPIVCGVGACGVCAVQLHKGTRMLCSEGPVFDLRDVA